MAVDAAEFYLAGLTAESVLSVARGLVTEQRLEMEATSLSEVTLIRQKTLGRREAVSVGAWNLHGGVQVHIEAWADTLLFGKVYANPRRFSGRFATRGAWTLASTLLSRLGITRPESVFREE